MPSVTCFYFGNNPANGLVTEILPYFTHFYFLPNPQTKENKLILNLLSYVFPVLFLLAFGGITHTARHTAATVVFLANNVSLENVSKILGHSSIKMTQHYAKVLDNSILKDIRNVENVFG